MLKLQDALDPVHNIQKHSEPGQSGASPDAVVEDDVPTETVERGHDVELDEDELGHATQEIPHELINEKVVCAGFLLKRGERRKTWKRRWVVLRPSRLAFYKNEQEYLLLNLVPTRDMRVVVPVEFRRIGTSIGIVTADRTLFLKASSQDETNMWIEALLNMRDQAVDNADLDPHLSRSPTMPSLSAQAHRYDDSADERGTAARRTEFQSFSRWFTLDSQVGVPFKNLSVPRAIDDSKARRPWPPTHSLWLSSSDDDQEPDLEDSSSMPSAAPRVASGASAALDKDVNRIIAQGYLMKQSTRRKHWRKRWFVLTLESLYYSRSHMELHTYRRVPTAEIMDVMEYDVGGATTSGPSLSLSPSSFPRLGFITGSPETRGAPAMPTSPSMDASASPSDTHHRSEHCFRIVTTSRSFVLCAPTEDEEIQWMSALQTLLHRQRPTSHAASFR
ncbi:hypothetical protein MCAP1_000175 [Malassezia caprae]|uniref:PH domain-containing protein n=1 Tax=Malassezia caprae TaxID=1381934 RepID=A0AAF0ITL1_9BASI|nr:hypothetical protein MCAP1_000175 [Malassezia caprae]